MKIGIWGLGSIGMRHAKNAIALGHDVHGYDPDADRHDIFKDIGGAVCADDKNLLQTCDAIVICTPNHFHFDHLQHCIAQQCHVLIEKPMAHQSAGLHEILDNAKSQNLIIAPAMNMRFDDVVKTAKDIITSKKYGRPLWARFTCSAYLPSWRPHQDHTKGYTNDPKTGGVIFDIIHEFDIAHYLLGSMRVQGCHAHNSGLIGLSSEDCADINLLSVQDATAVSIHLDYISRINQRFFEIQFEECFMKADLNARSVTVMDEHNKLIEIHDITQGDTTCYEEEMAHFIAAIEGKSDYPCPANEALDVLKTVIDARKKAGLPS